MCLWKMPPSVNRKFRLFAIFFEKNRYDSYNYLIKMYFYCFCRYGIPVLPSGSLLTKGKRGGAARELACGWRPLRPAPRREAHSGVMGMPGKAVTMGPCEERETPLFPGWAAGEEGGRRNRRAKRLLWSFVCRTKGVWTLPEGRSGRFEPVRPGLRSAGAWRLRHASAKLRP